MKGNRSIWDIIIRALLFIWCIGIILPIFWMIYESLKTNQEFFMSVWALPKKIRLENYAKAWGSMGIMVYMRNTVYLLVITLAGSTIINSMASYIFGRFQFKLSKLVFGIIVASMMLPGLNAISTQFVLMKQLGLMNKIWGLSIFLIAGSVPFSIFLLTGFLKTIPKEMEESSYVDGGSYSYTFFKIILPMCKPGLISVNIFNFLGVYNSYLAPLLFISDNKKLPIAVGISNMHIQMKYQADWVALLAGAIISMIPVILFYAIFQKKLISGTTLGAVKG